jgi:hypothetical protein
MFNLLIKFFYPYIQFLMGAAYSIQQTLEGLGIATSNFLVRDSSGKIINSYWSVSEAVLPTLGILLIYSFLLFCAFCIAGYCLGRVKGTAIALLVLLSPGLFSTIDLWPAINFIPERFNIGGLGSLGSSVGMISLVCLGLLSGWTLIVVATDFFVSKIGSVIFMTIFGIPWPFWRECFMLQMRVQLKSNALYKMLLGKHNKQVVTC